MVDIEEIMQLISLKKEGPYWDFKRQWYEENHDGDMLHDIICMANNLVNRDAYLIIGVDEEHNYCPYHIAHDPRKRNTQQLVDFLRGKKFAGDFRPEVTVEHCEGYGYKLDVIVIHNSINTPFYLKERYKQLNSSNIYVRVQDTNTPTDQSADIYHVEHLWKKRLGLIQTPLEKIQLFLSHKDEWENLACEDERKYYRWAPEYTIGYPFEDPYHRDGYEVYFLNQTDNTPHWTVIQLKYHQTVLKEMSGIMLDGGRHFSPCPLKDGVSLNEFNSWDVRYYYWIKDSLEYAVHQFYINSENQEAIWSEERLMKNILVFESENEHQNFNYYVKENWIVRDYTQKEKDSIYVRIRKISGLNVDFYKEELLNLKRIHALFLKFKSYEGLEN